MTLEFPEYFFWGSSTSAAQIETAYDHQWKGLETKDGHLFERTIDHEKRRMEDLEYICQFGTVYRCSLDWSRLQRGPRAPFNPEAVYEYRTFFEELNKRGVKIMLVLYHFAHPKWFEHNKGWLNEDNIANFVDFCCRCSKAFGQYINKWNTFNEPNVYAANAYILKEFPPFKRSIRKGNRALRNMGKAHDIVYTVLKENHPLNQVGISLNTAWFTGTNILGKISAAICRWWFHRRSARIFEKVDFWGLSYYAHIPFTPFPVTEIKKPGQLNKMGIPHDEMWGYYPKGFEQIIRYFWKHYKKPIIITERGICTKDQQKRIDSIKDDLMICHNLLEEKVDLRGYIHWSTFDNFEWHLGPSYRFGLVSIDPETKERRLTEAGKFYARFTKEKIISL